MLHYVYRRSNNWDNVKDEYSSALKCYGSFTFNILASSEAKVIFLLWGRFKGIMVGLDREDN